jgi:hypothetical protein
VGDGHTGTRIVEIKKNVFCHNFILAFTHLEEQNRTAWCVLHVHTRIVGVRHGLSPADFLHMLGFREYGRTCPALQRRCHYKYTRQLNPGTVGSKLGVAEFDAFADSINYLYEKAEVLARSIGDHSDFVRWGAQFCTEPKAPDAVAVEPEWAEEHRIQGHQGALDALAQAEAIENRFRTIESCLYEDGPELETAVQYTLSDLGLEMQKTAEGEHVDLILDYPRKNVEIGIEVTGVKGSLGTRTSKLNQVQVYLEECGERGVPAKGVIVANSHKATAPSERAGLQQFTDTLIKAMKGSEVVGLTTVDLCRIWEDVNYHGRDINTVIDAICDHEGGAYNYLP